MDLEQFSLQMLQQRYTNYGSREFVETKSIRFRKNETDLEDTDAFRYVIEVIGNEGRTRTTLASVFWQIFALSPEFQMIFRLAGIDEYFDYTQGRLILSMKKINGGRRYDLLILSPEIRPEDSFSFDLKGLFGYNFFNRTDFRRSYVIWLDQQYSELAFLFQSGQLNEETYQSQTRLLDAFRRTSEDFFIDALNKQDFAVIVGPMPRMVYTSSIATPAAGIALQSNGKAISSAGVIIDQPGKKGVTAALHGVVDDPDQLHRDYARKGESCVVGKTVYVNGQKGIITSADLIQDSCFIECDILPVAGKILRGPLRAKGPAREDRVHFDGITSGEQSTIITEVDIGITTYQRGRQTRVYTKPVTNRGDSGAALYNEDDYILGFASRRTGLNEKLDFAEWIWADSVFNVLGL